MACALLVPHQDVLELVLLEHGVVNRQDGAAGVAEHVFDPLIEKGLDHHFGAGHFLAHRLLHVPSPWLGNKKGP